MVLTGTPRVPRPVGVGGVDGVEDVFLDELSSCITFLSILNVLFGIRCMS